jgi:hypothetical protein
MEFRMRRTLIAIALVVASAKYLPAGADREKSAKGSSATTVTLERVLPELGSVKRLRRLNGSIFLLSRTDDSLLELDRDYNVRRRIGEIGSGPGDLYHPEDFDVAADGTIWVADRGNDRIQGFSADGKVLGEFRLREPSSIAALPGGELAIVQQFDTEVIRIFDRKGREVRSIGEITEVPGASDSQVNYYNRAKLTSTRSGEVMAAFRFLIPAVAKLYGADGTLKASFQPSSVELTGAVIRLRQARSEDLKKSTLGGRVSLTGSAIDDDGFVWLAPTGMTTVFRFAPNGRQVQEFKFKGEDGRDFGIHDLIFDGRRVLAVSGPFLLSGTLPQ